MKSFMTMLSDFKDSKAILTFIIFLGAISSSFKAIVVVLTNSLEKALFPKKPLNLVTEETGQSVLNSVNPIKKIDVLGFAEQLNLEPIYLLALLIGSCLIFANVARYFFMRQMRFIAERKIVSIRERLMKSALLLNPNLDKSNHGGTGDIISRTLNDVNIYHGGLLRMAEILKEPFLVLLSIIILFSISYKVTLCLMISLPPVLFILRRISKSLRKHSKSSQETMGSLTMILKEALDGKRVIHSFQLEDKSMKKFTKGTQKYFSVVKKIISREEMAGPISESLMAIVMGLTLILIYFLAQSEGLDHGDFLSIIAAMGFLSDSAKKVQNGFVKVQQGLVAKERVSELLNHVPKETQKQDLALEQFPDSLKSIDVKNLLVDLGNTRILNGVSLNIEAGQTIALVGPSGSGKTTFLNILDRYVGKTSGKIYFNETEIDSINSFSLRKNISLVNQDPFLFNDTILENLRCGDDSLTEERAWEILTLANASFVKNLTHGVHTKVGERGSQLSGGERQRISIARALAKNAQLVLLDEATSALDTHSEIEVQRGLDKLMKGRTCIVVAHRLSTIINADKILVFENGKILESGTHASLLSQNGLYSSLYGNKNKDLSL